MISCETFINKSYKANKFPPDHFSFPPEIINPETVARFAYRLARFIEKEKPDYIIACDRGARPIALAVHLLYRELYGNLPTKDGKIHFRKISGRLSPREFASLKRQIQSVLTNLNRMPTNTKNPTVLILDDWVFSSLTKEVVTALFEDLLGERVRLLYGVMIGKGGDVSGYEERNFWNFFCEWKDNPTIIGVDYDENLRPHRVQSAEAIEYRRRIAASVKLFAWIMSLEKFGDLKVLYKKIDLKKRAI